MLGDPDLDRRTYDLLRLVNTHEPVGSIRLTERMHHRGYRIEDRTIRLALADLDEAGFTAKVPGRGRRLTAAGRAELDRGDVSGRLERVRERIAMLTSRVTYDPTEDSGDLVVGTVTVPRDSLPAVFDALRTVDDSPLGPASVGIVKADEDSDASGGDVDCNGTVGSANRLRNRRETDGESEVGNESDDRVRLAFPSSITLDGSLLSWGIDADLTTAGLVEYHGNGDEVVRYVDAISGEGSTMDVVSLLIEAGRTDVDPALDGGTGTLIVDNREFPLARFGEARDLAEGTAASLGGVVDVRRPREPGPFPLGGPGWEFASLTYGGIAEIAVALLCERGLADDWDTLFGTRSRSDLRSLPSAEAAIEERGLFDYDD